MIIFSPFKLTYAMTFPVSYIIPLDRIQVTVLNDYGEYRSNRINFDAKW